MERTGVTVLVAQCRLHRNLKIGRLWRAAFDPVGGSRCDREGVVKHKALMVIIGSKSGGPCIPHPLVQGGAFEEHRLDQDLAAVEGLDLGFLGSRR